MARKGLVRGLAHRLLTPKGQGKPLKAVKEESRRLRLEFRREAIDREVLSLVVEKVLLRAWSLGGLS